MSKESNETLIDDLVSQVQNVLKGQEIVPAVDVLARVLISLGCSLNNISGEITPDVIRQINNRYYTPGKANIADAIILQAYTMLSWGEPPTSTDTKEKKETI